MAWGATMGLVGPVWAQDGAVPVEREPNHRTVFQNQWIQVFRVKLAPGEATLMHVHAWDDAAVQIAASTTVNQPLGQPEQPPGTAAPGNVSARTNEPTPTIHRVRNVGATLFEVIDVQALARPEGPESPPIVAPTRENPRIRVYRYELGPEAGAAEHTHTRPYLIVAATPIRLETSGSGGPRTEVLEPGDFRWFTGTMTHRLGNQGTGPAIVVEFELR